MDVDEDTKRIEEELNETMVEIEKLKKELKEEMKEIREEIEKLKKELKEELKETREKIEKLKKELKELKERKEDLEKKIEEKLKKIRKEHNEELKNVITEKNEMVRIVMKDNDKKLEEKRCELEELEDTNSTLIIKERQSTGEIQEAFTELIMGLRDLSCEGSLIRVKRMGHVDEKLFMKVCKQKFIDENVEVEYAMLCSKWQNALNDSAWHPFKRVGTGENMKEVVDDEDEKLKSLREEWGEDVKNAVKTAIEEMNEFNPSGRYSVPVLWNFEHGRKATLKEGIAHMTQQIKNLKRKRT
ncbi:unnamed protein product [Brassica rapa]|uniref:Factor of DNA methylation 1-5/IDN2 domain-containing protein n=1 Tax=Brassica campestris TaxID=3711 RepID=A0A3P6A714_BRACM|nr:unnamed protein product [Brassica rapa]VDC89426.1 unnamed protein product [Brassica rapa]